MKLSHLLPLLISLCSPTLIVVAASDNSDNSVMESLKSTLSLPLEERKPILDQKWAQQAIDQKEAVSISQLLLDDRLEFLRSDRKKEMENKSITIGDKTLRYKYRTLGKKPHGGHSLYISLHGGGNAPARVNDQQWSNQIKLYTPKEGIYVAPRAPTDTWDLWHQGHIDPLFDRLIENFITNQSINTNKIYILGYSAGGDGLYQLAPRMADRWAGAAMMAGHPGDAKAYNLFNLPYIIQCGGKDAAYNRNKLCAEWGEKLDELEKKNPGQYPHKCIVYPKYGHWMNGDDKLAIPWMAKHTRNPWPKKLHWYQDNVTHTRFYWLANPNPQAKQFITAEVSGQTITLTLAPQVKEGDNSALTPLPSIDLRLSDDLLDLDQAITVKTSAGKTLFHGKVKRTTAAIAQSIQQRPDLNSVGSALLSLKLD